MPVSIQTPYNSSTANGVTTVFPYTFKILNSADLKVKVGGVLKALSTDYTVSGVGGDGGNVTFVTAPANGAIVVRYSDTLLKRDTDYQQNGDFLESVVDADFDRLWLALRDAGAVSARALRAPVGEALSELPAAATRAGAFLGFDSSGQPTMLATADLGETVVSGYMETLLDAADAPAARALLGAATQPCVTMIRTQDSTNDTVTSAAWKVILPDGSRLDTTGTTSEGLQEAINYAARYGYDLFVYGGGIKALKWGAAYGGALGTNPFTTTNGSNVVAVAHTAHGLTTGDKVTFDGLSAALNGIPEAQIENVEKAVTVTGVNGYTFTTTNNATSSGAAGGASVRYQHSGQDVAIISCTAGLDIPPIQGVRWDIHATINFGGSGGTPAIDFDSIMASDIKFSGQIVASSGYSIGVRFRPTLELPQDPNGPTITSSYIELPSVVMAGGGGVGIDMDASAGGISSNIWKFIEPNEGAVGIRVQVGASTTFDHNQINAVDIHAQDTSINAGVSATNAANIFGNTWNVQCDASTGGVGVEIWGRNETWTVSVTNLEGSPTTGITLNTSAKQNHVTVLRNDASTKVNDAATEKSNVLYTPRSAVDAHKNATNQTGVATATWTKVTYGTEVLDALGEWASSTFTVTHAGLYLVRASAMLIGLGPSGVFKMAIAKGGTRILIDEGGNLTGGAADTAVSICSPLLLAAGDTIEIQVNHNHGSNRDISGDITLTRFSIVRLQGS